jgi:putative transposase
MAILMLNAALRIHHSGLNGLYRVVAMPPGTDHVWLGFIGPDPIAAGDEKESRKTSPALGSIVRVANSLIQELEEAGSAAEVEMHAAGHRLCPELLEGRPRTIWERRCALARPFLNHTILCNALEEKGGLGLVIKLALLTKAGSRASAYRVWELMCIYGFDVSSLVPDFALCGAPGVRRPIGDSIRKAGAKTLRERMGGIEPHPQRGITAEDRIKIAFHYKALMRPGMAFQKIYVQIIQRLYAPSYHQTPRGQEPILP